VSFGGDNRSGTTSGAVFRRLLSAASHVRGGLEGLDDLVVALSPPPPSSCRIRPTRGSWRILPNTSLSFGSSMRSCGRLGPATLGFTLARHPAPGPGCNRTGPSSGSRTSAAPGSRRATASHLRLGAAGREQVLAGQARRPGSTPMVAPYSGAHVGDGRALQGPRGSTLPRRRTRRTLPTTLALRSISVTVRDHVGFRFTPRPESTRASARPPTSGVRKYVGCPSMAASFRLDGLPLPPGHDGRGR